MIAARRINIAGVPPGPRPVPVGLRRGAAGRCPNCGRGRLFRGYFKVRPICKICAHDDGHYPSDDAPPYFTILILGHLVIGPLLIFRFIWTWPVGLVLAILMPSLTALTLTLLPIVKGAVVGVLWALEKPGHPEAVAP